MSEELGAEEVRRLVAAVPSWHHVLELPHGIRTPGAYEPRDIWWLLRDVDLRGKRVLDVGARDGYFSFACERRGAEVVAVDHSQPELTGFPLAKRLLGSSVEYVQANVYDLRPEDLGTFDVVLFLGVLYHLRHPLLALDRLRALCRERLYLAAWVADEGFFTSLERRGPRGQLARLLRDLPLTQFLPVGRFHPDATNKWLPNVAFLRALLAEARFEPLWTERAGEVAVIGARPVEAEETQRWIALDSGVRHPGS